MPYRRLSAALAALAVLAAFAVTPAGSAPEPYVIPAVLPVTGPAAIIGAQVATALHIFENYANTHGGLRGQPIHFDIKDDGSNVSTSVQLFNGVLAQHPAVVLGPTPTQTCNALAPLAEKVQVVVYCSSPGALPPKGGYVFCSAPALPEFDRGIIRYMRLKGYRKFAIISSNDGSGQANDAATREVLALPESSDLKVVTWEHINNSDIDATAQATHIKNSGADAIIAWVAGPTFGTFLRSLRDAGVDLPLTPNGANVDPVELAQFNDFLPKEMPLAAFPFMAPTEVQRTPLRGPVSDLIAAYRAAGQPLTPGVGYAWDMAWIVFSGLRKIGPNATATQLRDYILGLRDFAGVDGIYNFADPSDQHGLSDRNVVMVGWDGKTKGWIPLSGLGSVPVKR